VSDEAAKAVEALVALVEATLRGKEPGRFGKAAQLCSLGQGLARLEAKSVEDFQAVDPGNPMAVQGFNNYGVNGAVMPRFHGNVGVIQNQAAYMGDQGEVERNDRLAQGTLAQASTETVRAAAALHEADELKTLIALVDKVPFPKRATLEARIAKLIEHMETRNAANVADSDVSRGHPAGEQGGEANAPPRLRPNGVGGEGHGVLAGAGDGPEAVG
jgi:hypothetical protein